MRDRANGVKRPRYAPAGAPLAADRLPIAKQPGKLQSHHPHGLPLRLTNSPDDSSLVRRCLSGRRQRAQGCLGSSMGWSELSEAVTRETALSQGLEDPIAIHVPWQRSYLYAMLRRVASTSIYTCTPVISSRITSARFWNGLQPFDDCLPTCPSPRNAPGVLLTRLALIRLATKRTTGDRGRTTTCLAYVTAIRALATIR